MGFLTRVNACLFIFSHIRKADNADKFSLRKKLGSLYFTQACLLDFPCLDGGQNYLCSSFLNLTDLIDLSRKFISSILWGKDLEGALSIFSGPIAYLTPILVRHGQYEAAEVYHLIYLFCNILICDTLCMHALLG